MKQNVILTIFMLSSLHPAGAWFSYLRFGRGSSPEWWPQLLIYDIIMQVYVLKEILLKGITNKAPLNITKLHYWIENFVKTRKKAVKCTAMVRGCVLIQIESNAMLIVET